VLGDVEVVDLHAPPHLRAEESVHEAQYLGADEGVKHVVKGPGAGRLPVEPTPELIPASAERCGRVLFFTCGLQAAYNELLLHNHRREEA